MDSLIPSIAAITKTYPMIIRSVIVATALAWQLAGAQTTTIFWSSPPNAVNHTAAGQPMGGDFLFELGVFAGTFTPDSSNLAQWSANWRPLQRLSYDPIDKRYTGAHDLENNTSPFTVNKPVYVWGFTGDSAAAEWILFRASSWTLPNAGAMVPSQWFANASGVTAVIGTVDADGSPFLMRSASVTGVVPPPTSWEQWRDDKLAGEPLNKENDDPDGDGLPNQLEFAFGSDPRQRNVAPPMPLTLESVDNQNYLQISVPRRKDHVVSVSVQVSSDLSTWNEGPSFVQIIDDGALALVVRDLTPYPPENGRRFMRLRALVPPP